MASPAPGQMYYWRMRSLTRSGDELRYNPWQFGYCTFIDAELVRMGRWNGDTMGGQIVSRTEIEIREYNR